MEILLRFQKTDVAPMLTFVVLSVVLAVLIHSPAGMAPYHLPHLAHVVQTLATAQYHHVWQTAAVFCVLRVDQGLIDARMGVLLHLLRAAVLVLIKHFVMTMAGIGAKIKVELI